MEHDRRKPATTRFDRWLSHTAYGESFHVVSNNRDCVGIPRGARNLIPEDGVGGESGTPSPQPGLVPTPRVTGRAAIAIAGVMPAFLCAGLARWLPSRYSLAHATGA